MASIFTLNIRIPPTLGYHFRFNLVTLPVYINRLLYKTGGKLVIESYSSGAAFTIPVGCAIQFAGL